MYRGRGGGGGGGGGRKHEKVRKICSFNKIFNFLTNWLNQLILTMEKYKQEY